MDASKQSDDETAELLSITRPLLLHAGDDKDANDFFIGMALLGMIVSLGPFT